MNTRSLSSVVLAAALLAPVAPLARSGQSPAPAPQPQFEVASIKPNKSGDGRVMLGLQPGGRFNATNVTLRMLIRNAYQIQDFQLVGGPSWLTEDRFDIVAKAEDGTVSLAPPPPGQPSPISLMIRALLAERFKLVLHEENRDMAIYALILARSDGKFGPQLKKSDTDCAALAAARGRGAGGPPPLPTPGAPPPPCSIRIGPGSLIASGQTLTQFASSLGNFAGRIVVDKSGLEGGYDFTLNWTPDQAANRPPGAPPGPDGAPVDPNGPSLFTALQEQLGLKLDSQRGPVKVFVIDRVERPTEN